ncbi:SpoIIE family protein phosphatase [bacterium BMS3Abin03]|nr:SpoIIE family protein phosphatase [bacterium BMS3Abin03]
MKNFQIVLIIRVLILAVSIFLLSYLYFNLALPTTQVIVLALIVLQVYLLIRHVNVTNYELSKFFNSVKYSDFSRVIMPKKLGLSFKELNKSLSNVIKQFQTTRSETEEHFQYLQTVVKQVGTGLISFTDNGDITLFNESAKKILNTHELKNIHSLTSISRDLFVLLNSIRTGEKELLKLFANGRQINLSIFASEFKLRGEMHKLVSLQDISSELERERLHNELEIARDVQFKMLPKENPTIPGYLISSMCIPALEVGGDYFDFIKINESKIGIVIADVAGKGLPAAIYMTLTKGAFQSYAALSNSPKEVLTKLNSLIYDTIERGSFITMFYAVIDFENNKLIFARAGHEPVIHFNNKEEKLSLLRPVGIGLGLEEGKIFSRSIEEKEIEISEGDSLLFLTDGLTDSKNEDNNDFGMKNLLDVIKNYNGKGLNTEPKDLLSNVHNKIKTFRNNSPQYDDITAIAVTKKHSDTRL